MVQASNNLGGGASLLIAPGDRLVDTGGELSSPIYNRRWCVADMVGLLAPVEPRAHMPPASTLSLIRKMLYTEVSREVRHRQITRQGEGRYMAAYAIGRLEMRDPAWLQE